MGQISKIGDTYYIEFYARGLLYSKVAGSDRAAAERLLKETEETIASGEALTIVREIDLPVFVQQFYIYASQEFSARTVIRFKLTGEHFTSFLIKQYPMAIHLSNITPSVIETYKLFLAATVRPKVVNFTLLLLREMMEHGIKLGFIHDNPTLHVQLLPLPNKRRPLTKRYQLAKEFLVKMGSFGRVFRLLKLNDIARMMYFSDLIPLSREEMYKA